MPSFQGNRPANKAYAISPSAYRSAAPSTFLASACSGAIHALVPIAVIARVWFSNAVESLAIPKSNTTGRPSGRTMMLAGLRSL